MTHEEIIEALERALNIGDSPVGECFGTILPRPVLAAALCLIEHQHEANIQLQAVYTQRVNAERAATVRLVSGGITNIICQNTYPSFDKDGKPVNVWKAKEGYAAIDKFVEDFYEYIRGITEEAPHESETTNA